jgi:hypothetical protein
MLNGRLVNGRVEIPVVVNVLYNTAAENISLTQIQSQIGLCRFQYKFRFQQYTLFSELQMLESRLF